MRVGLNDFAQLLAGFFLFAFREVKLGKLHAGARVGVMRQHTPPELDGHVRLAERSGGFGEGHERVTVVVLLVLLRHAFQPRQRVGGLFLAQQALAEMRAGVAVGGVAVQRGTVVFLGEIEFAALEINIAEREVMMRLVEMVDLRLEFLDAPPRVRAGKILSEFLLIKKETCEFNVIFLRSLLMTYNY